MKRLKFLRETQPGKFAYPILTVLLVMWLVQIVDTILPIDLNRFGLLPRTFRGLIGIVSMPFLHASFAHLAANTVPLAILMALTLSSRNRAWPVIVAIVLLNGVLLWLFGRPAVHVGASGLVFGLIAYLITVGIREKEFLSIAIALFVGIVFGATLLSGVIPSFGTSISWDGHLTGAISGLLVAIGTSRRAAL